MSKAQNQWDFRSRIRNHQRRKERLERRRKQDQTSRDERKAQVQDIEDENFLD